MCVLRKSFSLDLNVVLGLGVGAWECVWVQRKIWIWDVACVMCDEEKKNAEQNRTEQNTHE